jgi:hypothetical protein
MNRLTAWTVAAVIAALVAVFDLVSAWPYHLGSGAVLAITLGMFGVALGLLAILLVGGSSERRRIIAAAASSADLIRAGARSVRLSAIAAIALGILLFANCSASVTSGPTSTSGAAMDDVSGLLRVGAEVLLPILLVIVLAAALATAAQVFASREHWRSAHRAAQAAVWAAVAIVVMTIVTVPIGFIFGVAYCDVGGSPGGCAAGLSSFGDVFLVGAAAVVLPYVLLLVHAVDAAPPSSPPELTTEH